MCCGWCEEKISLDRSVAKEEKEGGWGCEGETVARRERRCDEAATWALPYGPSLFSSSSYANLGRDSSIYSALFSVVRIRS